MAARLRRSLPGLVALMVSIAVVVAIDAAQAPPDFRTPQRAVAVAPAPAAASGSGAVVAALRWSDAVTASLGRVRAGCLAEQGFEQARRALEWRRPAAGTVRREPLTVPLQDLGPADAAEARRFGLAGMSLAFDEGAAGVLVGHDPRFDRAVEQCDRWIYDDVAPGLRRLQTRAASFRDLVEGDFVDGLGASLTPVLLQRARCVREAYPAFAPRRILDSELTELVTAAGVRPGELRDRTPELSAADAPHGRVVVRAPVPADVYVPTPGERSLALRWVGCGERVALSRRLAQASARSRAEVETEQADAARALGAALERQWHALAAAAGD